MFYKNKLLLAAAILGLTFSTGCFGGSSSDGNNSIFESKTGAGVNLSGSYTTTDLSAATRAVIGNFTSITLTQSGSTLEGVDNLGNTYAGTIQTTDNEDASGSSFTIHSTTPSGVTITLIATYDPEEIDYVPASSSTLVDQYWNLAGTEQYEDTKITIISAKTTSYKTWIGQMVLSSGPSSSLTLRGDIVITGGDISSTITTTKIS